MPAGPRGPRGLSRWFRDNTATSRVKTVGMGASRSFPLRNNNSGEKSTNHQKYLMGTKAVHRKYDMLQVRSECPNQFLVMIFRFL